MRVSARLDYALRALLLLADHAPERVTLDQLSAEGALPRKFLEAILTDLRRMGLVVSRRGLDGGHTLALPANRITVGDVIRLVEGPLMEPPCGRDNGSGPHAGGHSSQLDLVWRAMATSLSGVADRVTLEQVRTGRLPPRVMRLSQGPPHQPRGTLTSPGA